MEQLVGLDSCRPLSKPALSRAMLHVETPVKLQFWEAALAEHPDARFAEYILNGLMQVSGLGSNTEGPVCNRLATTCIARKQLLYQNT